MARLTFAGRTIASAGFRFVRHNAANETVPSRTADETAVLDALAAAAARLGTSLRPGEAWVEVPLAK